jgi:hypothetical protein
VTCDRCLVSRDIGDSRACPKLGSWCRRSLANRCLSAKRPPRMGCHGSTSIDGSLVTATRVLTVWSRGHDDRIPIRSALPRRWRSGSSRYAASSPRQGLDHGPQTIGWHLEQQHLPVPSTSTIRRILVAAGLVTAEPRKRPKSSYRRFEADQPNECWQSDFTH